MQNACPNCGAGLLDEQRFCRYCGRPSISFSDEEEPTREMPRIATSRQTAPAGRADTRRASPAIQPAEYRYPTQVVPPARKGGWPIVLFLMAGCLSALIIIGVAFYVRSGRVPQPPAATPIAVTLNPGERAFEEGLEVAGSGRETVMTRRFTLPSDGIFTIEDIDGEVVIEGWDQPESEVTVTRRSRSDRRPANEVAFAEDERGVRIRTLSRGARRGSVAYRVRLPKEVAGIEVSTVSGTVSVKGLSGAVGVTNRSGDVDLAELAGDVKVETVSGKIKLVRISGDTRARSVSGDVRAEMDGLNPESAVAINSVSGRLEVSLLSEIDLDLSARTTSGRIDLDEAFGMPVERQLVGRRAAGRIGNGGRPLTLETVSGNIKVTR